MSPTCTPRQEECAHPWWSFTSVVLLYSNPCCQAVTSLPPSPSPLTDLDDYNDEVQDFERRLQAPWPTRMHELLREAAAPAPGAGLSPQGSGALRVAFAGAALALH